MGFVGTGPRHEAMLVSYVRRQFAYGIFALVPKARDRKARHGSAGVDQAEGTSPERDGTRLPADMAVAKAIQVC